MSQLLTTAGLLLDFVGALLLGPSVASKAKRINVVYKALRTEDVNLSAFQANAFLRDIDTDPARTLQSPAEELRLYRREVLPVAIGVSLLTLGFLLQLISSAFQMI